MPIELPVIVFPDAEAVTATYLRARLAASGQSYASGVTVATRLVPGQTPTRFVRVRRAGGVRTRPVIDIARLDALVWHEDDQRRMQLAQLARGLLHAMEGDVLSGVPVYGVEDVLGPTVLPDPADDTRSIVMLTVEARFRGSQLA